LAALAERPNRDEATQRCAAVLKAAAPSGQVAIINERYRGHVRGSSSWPGFHFGLMARGMTWTTSLQSTDAYAAYWIQRIETTSPIPREDWDRELRRLIDDGVFHPVDEPTFDKDFRQTSRDSATPRPTLWLERAWQPPLKEDLSGDVRGALRQALVALEEPIATISG
jgi:hypothetical protein